MLLSYGCLSIKYIKVYLQLILFKASLRFAYKELQIIYVCDSISKGKFYKNGVKS